MEKLKFLKPQVIPYFEFRIYGRQKDDEEVALRRSGTGTEGTFKKYVSQPRKHPPPSMETPTV